MVQKKKIAIIGTGISGLAAATGLEKTCDITFFEKARGVGGRIATRYAGVFEFDHGAQYFTVKNPVFHRFIEPLYREGIVRRWDARFVEIEKRTVTLSRQWNQHIPHYVADYRMNTLPKHIAKNFNVYLEKKITNLHRINNQWQLQTDQDKLSEHFDWVILAIPSHQAIELLPKTMPFTNQLSNVVMKGCYVLMLGFENNMAFPWDAALVKQSCISWISVNSSKPNRPEKQTLVVLSSNQWADDHNQDEYQSVKHQLWSEATNIIGLPLSQATHHDLHQWRYANYKKNTLETSWIDEEQQVGLCGDWTQQGRVEAAFLSGVNLANQILLNIK